MTDRLLIAYGLMALLVLSGAALLWRARMRSPRRLARLRDAAYFAEEKAWRDKISRNTLRSDDASADR